MEISGIKESKTRLEIFDGNLTKYIPLTLLVLHFLPAEMKFRLFLLAKNANLIRTEIPQSVNPHRAHLDKKLCILGPV